MTNAVVTAGATGNKLLVSEEITSVTNDSYITPDKKKEAVPATFLSHLELLTFCWSCKEAIFKWYGYGGVDFKKHMPLKSSIPYPEAGWIQPTFLFSKDTAVDVTPKGRFFDELVLAYVIS
jgi:hypothetical protein